MKAFDVLERLDADPEFWEGKRGAAIGVFQLVVAGAEDKERLIEVINMLKNTSNPQVEYFVQIMKKWGKDNGFKFWFEWFPLSSEDQKLSHSEVETAKGAGFPNRD